MLKVHVSDDCGDSWDEVYGKTSDKLETKEIDFDESQEWVPGNVDDWRWETIELAKYKGKKSLKIKLENTTGYGNYIWVDNINIDLTSGNQSTSKQLKHCT